LRIAEAIVSGDFSAFGEVLEPDALWIGALPGQVCRGRAEIVGMFERAAAAGRRTRPEILAEGDGVLVVDPHVEPRAELNPALHQVVVHDGESVTEIRDYPDRASALAAFERLRELYG